MIRTRFFALLVACLALVACDEAGPDEAAPGEPGPFANLGQVLALGPAAEALQEQGTKPLKPAQIPGVADALGQRSDRALAEALNAAGIEHVVVDPAASTRAPIPPDTVFHRFPLLRAMAHFSARLIAEKLVLYDRIAPFPEIPVTARAALLEIARDVMKGGKGELPAGSPGILTRKGEWEMNICLRPRGRHLGFHYAKANTLAEVARRLGKSARNAYERKGQHKRYGPLEKALDKDLTIELEVMHDFGRLEGPRDRELLWRTLEPGLYGAHIQNGERNFVMPPWYSVARNKDSVWDFLDALIKWAKLDEQVYFRENFPIRRFRAVHWRENGPGGPPQALARAFPEPPAMKDLSRESVKRSLRALADWISVNQVKPSGRYVYRYFPSTDSYSKDREFNFVRHCVGIFGMWLAHTVDPQPRDLKTIEAGYRYIDRSLKWGGPPPRADGTLDTSATEWMGKPLPGKDVALLIYDPDEGAATAKMGAAAVTILGLTQAEQAGVKLTPEREKLLRGLAGFLEYMQRPDGSFNHYYSAQGSSFYGHRNSIYPGEILYAVARLHGRYKDVDGDKWKTIFRQSMKTNMEWFKERMVQRRPDGLYEERLRKDLVQFQPWIAMSMEEMHRHDPDPIYLENSNLVSEWIIDSYQYTPERAPYPDYVGGYFKVHDELPAMHTFVYTEGTAASYMLAKRAGADRKRLDRFRASALASARFIMQQQVMPGRNDYFYSNPGRAAGGVRYCLNHNKQRIDYEYHAMSALYRVYQSMSDEDYAWGAGLSVPSWD